MSKVRLSTMIEYLKNSDVTLGITFEFGVPQKIKTYPGGETVGEFNKLTNGKAWIEPIALVTIRKLCEEKGHGAASDKLVRDALTATYDDLHKAYLYHMAKDMLPDWLTGGAS